MIFGASVLQTIIVFISSLILTKKYRFDLKKVVLFIAVILISGYVYWMMGVSAMAVAVPLLMVCRYYFVPNQLEAIGTVAYSYLFAIISNYLTFVLTFHLLPVSFMGIVLISILITLTLSFLASWVVTVVEKI